MAAPLISIIIPTSGRPQYLPKALESVFSGDERDVEVIVVPNGNDRSWEPCLAPYAGDRRIKIRAILDANANQARNVGLELATGKFIRFLDDDDYVYPDAALRQCEAIESAKADLCSGSIDLVSESGEAFAKWDQPETDDFCVATLGPGRKCANLAHVYRRSSIVGHRWDPNTRVRQDIEWQFTLCARRELNWTKTADTVGAWRHHWSHRISSSIQFNDIRVQTVPMLLRAYDSLMAQGRLTEDRKKAIAAALWQLAHECFFLAPGFWTKVTQRALELDPTSKPPARMADWPLLKNLPGFWLEYLMLPKRATTHFSRILLKKLGRRHYW